MAGKRVLISGMGSELGWRVSSLLDRQPWVSSLTGIDTDPPRGRLRRATFHRIIAGEHERTVDVVTKFNPHIVVNIAVWEPHSRANPKNAARLTDGAATSILGAAAECRALESIVLRSGIEVYGRHRGSVVRPTEVVATAPTSNYGRTLVDVEATARAIGDRIGVSVATLRLATVIGHHVPSPLGRLLRQPFVPYSLIADPPFAVVHKDDAADAFVAATKTHVDQPVNIVADGAITMLQAIRTGRRVPLPLIGPEWVIARGVNYLTGAPIPDHVQELIHRGRLADNDLARELLGFAPQYTTRAVIEDLYDWPRVLHFPAKQAVA